MTVMEAQEKIVELEHAKGREENEKLIHELSAVAEELEMRRETLDDDRRAIAKQWDIEMHADTTEKLSQQEKELLGRMSQILAERAYLETLHLSVKAAQHGRPAFIQH